MKSMTLTSSTLAFALMVGAAASYQGGADPFWLFTTLVGLFIWASSIGVLRSTTIPVSGLSLTLAIALLWLLVLPAFSPIPEISWTTSLVLATLPIACFCGWAAADQRRQIVMTRRVLGTLAVLILGGAVLEMAVRRSRPFSIFLDANLLAAYANLFFFAALGEVAARAHAGGLRTALQSPIAAFAALALVTSFSTASFGGFLCFSGGLAVMAVVAGRRIPEIRKLLQVVLLLSVASYWTVYSVQDRPSPFSRVHAEVVSSGHASVQQGTFVRERMALYRSTLRMIADGPWYGSGTGLFPALYPRHRSPDDQSSAGDLAHNDYLQLLLDGGPILLAYLMAILATVAFAIYRTDRRLARGCDSNKGDLQRLGIQIALLAVLMHAAVNFIFYSLSMSILIGLFLSRMEGKSGKTIDLARYFTPTSRRLLAGFAVVLVTGSIGMTAAFERIESGKCELRGCQSLRAKPEQLAAFAELLTAMQPSWVDGQTFLIKFHRTMAQEGTDPVTRWQHRIRAVQIASTVLHRYPDIYPLYSTLGEIIETFPQIAPNVAEGVPNLPIRLYETAVQYNPMQAFPRARLAALQAAAGDDEAAWTTAFAGMRWWKLNIVSDSDRKLLLDIALPLAVRTEHCTDARELADGMKLMDPESIIARDVIAATADAEPSANTHRYCGLGSAPELPVWTPRPGKSAPA